MTSETPMADGQHRRRDDDALAAEEHPGEADHEQQQQAGPGTRGLVQVQFLGHRVLAALPVGVHEVGEEPENEEAALPAHEGAVGGHPVGSEVGGDEEGRRRAQDDAVDHHHHGREQGHHGQGQAVVVDHGADGVAEGDLGASLESGAHRYGQLRGGGAEADHGDADQDRRHPQPPGHVGGPVHHPVGALHQHGEAAGHQDQRAPHAL